jgi:hypothetical protein
MWLVVNRLDGFSAGCGHERWTIRKPARSGKRFQKV